MNGTYDIIIIGAGPAGLSAGRTLSVSTQKPSILLIDKIAPWKHPIACAEGVYLPQFHQVIKPKQSWIRFLVDKAIYHSPSNATIHYIDKNKGYIINRAIMQHDLADECIANGIECNCTSTRIQ